MGHSALRARVWLGSKEGQPASPQAPCVNLGPGSTSPRLTFPFVSRKDGLNDCEGQAAAGVSSLLVPWLNELLLLLSPSLLLTLTGKPKSFGSLSSLETWSCLCPALLTALWPAGQKTWDGARAISPGAGHPCGSSFASGVTLGWGCVSLALLSPDLGGGGSPLPSSELCSRHPGLKERLSSPLPVLCFHGSLARSPCFGADPALPSAAHTASLPAAAPAALHILLVPKG